MSHASDDHRRYAFVTLLTTDSYLPGALILAHTLRRAHSLARNPVGSLTPADIANLGPAGLSNQVDVEKKVDLVCLVTPATVSVKSVKALVRAFDKVVGVEPLSFAGLTAAHLNESKRRKGSQEAKAAKRARAHSRRQLALLGRPDLGEAAGASLTKLHAWRLTGYDKVVFLDADIIVLRPLAHLFSLTSALAASPDIGWPDAFNSGLLVFSPSLTTFSDICDYAISRGSWDGADQGLLNDYFGGDEASGEAGRGGGWQRLPFRYNVTPNAGYMFAPAYERYGRGIMAAHFIGLHKPWNRPRPTVRSKSSSSSPSTRALADYDSLLLQWHEAYEEYYPAATAKQDGGAQANVIHSERGVEVIEQPFTVPTYRAVWNAESDLAEAGDTREQSSLLNMRRNAPRARGRRSKSSTSSWIRGAGHAEDLHLMFHGDVVAASVAAEVAAITRDANKQPHEGVYISLPLDGRTSLMGVELDSGAEEDSEDSDDTLNAQRSGRPLPPDLVLPPASRMQGQAEHESGEWSPPKVSWDPSREPPPVGGGSAEYQMRTPVQAYYPNAWDQASQPKGKSAFFEVGRHTTQGKTMARLQREHYFDNLRSDRPDPSLVKAVFPWEEQQGSKSSRIFPDEEPNSVVPGSRGLDARLEAGGASSGEAQSNSAQTSSSTTAITTPQQTFSPPLSMHKGVPPTLSYTNAWDQVGAIGARRESKSQGSSQGPSSRAVQTASEGRPSRSSQTQVTKYRHRGAQADGSSGGDNAVLDPYSNGSHRQYGSGGSGGSGKSQGKGQGLRDASADQSADGDNESSSSSSSEGEEAPPHGSKNKWRREGPGPGYQRKVERLYEQTGTSPRSPRSHHFATLGGGSRSDGPHMSRSRSSSSSSNTPHPSVPTGEPTVTSRQRHRPDSGLQYVEDEDQLPSLDMSLSTAYEGAMNPMPYQRGNHQSMQWALTSPTSAHNSGGSSPLAIMTPLSQSPVVSRGTLHQVARTHSHAQGPLGTSRRRGDPW